MADLSMFLSSTSAAAPPRRDGIPAGELDAQNEDPSLLGEEMAALDSKNSKRSSALQGLTVDERIPSVLGPITSLASLRTASTELYVPPRRKGMSLKDGCVSSFKNDLQNSRQRTPVQKLETCNTDKVSSGRRPESNKKNLKKRKRSQTELATADVEAAIGSVISAGEAIVVSHLIDASSLSPGQDRAIILEAALSLGKARHLCGLDNYDLEATRKDFGELESQDLDLESMQEAYADVGIIVDVPEDHRQLLAVGTAVVNLSQQSAEVHAEVRCSGSCPTEVGGSLERIGGTISDVCKEIAHDCKSVEDISRSSVGQSGSIVAQQSEFGVLQSCERTGDNVQVHCIGTREVKEKTGKCQLPFGAPTIDFSNPLKNDGLVLLEKVKDPAQSCKLVAVVSSNSGRQIRENVPGDDETKIGNNQQDSGVLQELNVPIMERKAVSVSTTEVLHCQQNSEPRAVLLSRTSNAIVGGSSQVDGDPVKTTSTAPIQIQQSTSKPEENSDEVVSQAPNADLVIGDRWPHSDMVESSRHKAEHQEEVEGENTMVMDVGGSDKKASSDSKWSHPDIGKSTAILRGTSVEYCTRNLVTPYVSRWFGGWSSNAAFNPTAAVAIERSTVAERFSFRSLNDIGSEDAVPEQNAFLARQKSVPVIGQETTVFRSVSVDEAAVVSFAQNDEATSEKPKADSLLLGGPHSQALEMSQIDPLCSFVPCSISSPVAVSLLPCHGDYKSSMLAGTVEACARTAMNIIDSRKVVDCQQEARAIELESVPDPAVMTDKEASSEQILETRIDPVSLDDANVKRMPTSMKTLSTTTNSLSLLLHAVDIAGKSFPNGCTLEGGNLEQPSTRSPNVTSISPPLIFEGMQGDVEQLANCVTQTTTDLPDVTLTADGKRLLNEKRISNPDLWMGADLSHSPPLLWPRGKKLRLTACRVVDSDTTEWLHDYDDHRMLHKEIIEKKQHTLQTVTRQSGRLVLRTTTRSKPCHELKALFKGLQFLLTGFSSRNKEELSEILERCGGKLLADVPRFCPKQRFKRKGLDCGARSPPILIAPQQMRTHKYLYGCAVGAPLLDASWINACVSAVKNLPYHQYQHKHIKAGYILKTNTGFVSKSSEGPLFVGLQFLFHGQQDFISQLSTLAKHAGGKVIRKLVFEESEQKQRQNLVGLVVVEGSSNLPLELQRAASRLEYHVVDSEWMIVSLLNGKLMSFPTNSTPPSQIFPSQQSSAPKTGEPRQRCSSRRFQLRSENPESREDGGSGIELLVKKLKHRSLTDENRPIPSVRSKSAGKELEENTCWLGKGFVSSLQVPQLTERLLGPYSHSLAHQRVPKKFLYYEGFLCNGVEYFLGDIVEVRAPNADCPPSVARIEGLWSEEDGRRLPQTRAFPQGVRKRASKNVVLKCRRFYRPSDTEFPGQQGNSNTDELYLSNDIDKDVSASDVVRRVRLRLETADKVVHCRNWCDDDVVDDLERAAGASISHNEGTPIASRAANYFCSFFYDHLEESLHRIKLEDPNSRHL